MTCTVSLKLLLRHAENGPACSPEFFCFFSSAYQRLEEAVRINRLHLPSQTEDLNELSSYINIIVYIFRHVQKSTAFNLYAKLIKFWAVLYEVITNFT